MPEARAGGYGFENAQQASAGCRTHAKLLVPLHAPAAASLSQTAKRLDVNGCGHPAHGPVAVHGATLAGSNIFAGVVPWVSPTAIRAGPLRGLQQEQTERTEQVHFLTQILAPARCRSFDLSCPSP